MGSISMAGNYQYRPDRRSGPLLASTLVLFLGAIAAAVVTTASGKSPVVGICIFVAFAAMTPVFLWMLRATPQQTVGSLYIWLRSRETKPKTDYQPRPVRAQRTYGTNRPPSTEQLKDLKDGPNNWVPSNVPPAKHSHWGRG